MSYQRLKQIENDTFKEYHTDELIVLKLNNNRLKSLSAQSFVNFTSLDELNLSYNRLDTLEEGCFRSLLSLRILLLTGNHLAQLRTGMLYGLINLELLNLADNEIKIPDPSILPFIGIVIGIELFEIKLEISLIFPFLIKVSSH